MEAALVVDTAGAWPAVVEWAAGVGRLVPLTTVLDTVEGVSFRLTSWGEGAKYMGGEGGVKRGGTLACERGSM